MVAAGRTRSEHASAAQSDTKANIAPRPCHIALRHLITAPPRHDRHAPAPIAMPYNGGQSEGLLTRNSSSLRSLGEARHDGADAALQEYETLELRIHPPSEPGERTRERTAALQP
jgi:hypothetical protein